MKKKLSWKRKSFFKVLILFVFLMFFLLPQNLEAFGLHTLSDKMTRHAPNTASDHEIKFITPSGLGQSGQYLSIIFGAGFNLSTIDYTDIDLFHGPISGLENNESLSAAASATSWGVSKSSSQLDFYHPTDNLNGDIAPNDIVIIRIGLNASSGDQQIANPATIGSKIIEIAGNFGDNGKLAVPIANDQVGIQGQPPGTPPTAIILYPPFNISYTSMDLNWSANTDFDFNRYELYYSTSPGVTNLDNLLVTYTDSSETFFHVINLTPNTAYYFVVYVYDTDGLFVLSNEVSGTTLAGGGGGVTPPPPLPPAIDQRYCPIFVSPYTLTGTKEAGTEIYINGSNADIFFPTQTTWSKSVNLNLGENTFVLYARDVATGQNSNIVSATVIRWRVGDTNGNFRVDDYDLSALAAHFWTDWCFADFNEDDFVDDFDLSGLAANWDNLY